MSLGQAYGDVLNRVVIREDKLPVPAGEIGEAPLESGGPEERGGFRPSEIDITRMSDKDKKDNIYNIKGYTYGDGNSPGNTMQPDPTGPEFDQVPYSGIVGPEEDEETLSIHDTELLKAVKGYKNAAGKALLERAQREVQKQGYLSADTRQALTGDIYEEDEEQLVEWVGPAIKTAGKWALRGLGLGGAAAVVGAGSEGWERGAGPPQPAGDPGEGIGLSDVAIPAAVIGGLALASKSKKKKQKKSENEEDEEILAEHEKIARSGLNNFMSKSVFDKLYNKVMVNENFDEVEDVTDLEALGIETDEVVDEVPEEITVAIPGELAQTLCDILQTALAQQETEVEVDVDVTDVTDTEFEEDEEATMKDGGGYGIDAGSTLKHEVNYGKGGKNKVGKLRPAGGTVMKDGGGYGVDAGSTLGGEVNYGKQNKVGKLKVGKSAFEQ